MESFVVNKSDNYYELYFMKDGWYFVQYVFNGRILGTHRISQKEYAEMYEKRAK